MHNTCLSIVIPYYNQPEQLQALLDSLYAQTLKNIEIIIVDDCSEISPEHVISSMQKKGLNIIYLRQNERQFTLKARLLGMSNATGDYLAFMDSDDKAYENTSYENVLNFANKSQSDIIHFITMQNNKLGFSIPRPEAMPFANELYGDNIFTTWLQNNCMAHSVWNKLYSKKLYKKVLNAEHTIHIFRIEDFYLTCYFLHFAESYTSCNIPVYFYNPPKAKGSLEKLAGRSADSWEMYKHLPQKLKEHGLSEANALQLQKYLHTLIVLNLGTTHIHLKNAQDENLIYSDEIINIFKKYAKTEDIIANLCLANSDNVKKILKLYSNFN